MPLLAKTGSNLSSSAERPNSRLTRSTTSSWPSACGGTAVAKASRRGESDIRRPPSIGTPQKKPSPAMRERGNPSRRRRVGEGLFRALISSPASLRSAPSSRSAREGFHALVHQPVELGGVLAGDLVHDVGRQTGELLVDVFLRFRPYAVGVRVVRAPHDRFDADILDQLGADRVELERCAALAAPVFARLQLHQIAETVLEFEIHAVQRIGNPADAALAKADAQIGMPLEDAGAHH